MVTPGVLCISQRFNITPSPKHLHTHAATSIASYMHVCK